MAVAKRRAHEFVSGRAARETADRALADKGPAYLARWRTRGRYQITPHIRLLNDAFYQASIQGGGRYIISMPPRHSKSETCSKWGSVDYLRRFPDRKFAVASYGASLAATFGRQARNILAEDGPELGVELAKDSKAADEWHTTEGGAFYAVGVGGSFTGKGVHMLVVDDPFKDAKEAFSPTIRENVWDWWLSVASTRLEPGASVFIVMTRWHDDDLAGRLLKEAKEGGEQWTEIRLAALCDRADDPLGRKLDEPLWPERYDFDALDKRRKRQDWAWWALYQQTPLSSVGGSNITMDDLPTWEHPPHIRDLLLVTSWDPNFEDIDPELAAKRKRSKKSRFGGVVLGFDRARCYVLDHFCEHADFLKQQEVMQGTIARWPRARKHYLEMKANGAALAAQLHRDVKGILPVRPTESKLLRLNAVSPFFKARNVLFPPEHAEPWVRSLKTRLCNFPKVDYDDDIDALTQAIAAEWLDEVPDEEEAERAQRAQARDALYDSYK